MDSYQTSRFIIRMSGVVFFLLAIGLLIVESIYHVGHLPSKLVALLLVILCIGLSIYVFLVFFVSGVKKNRY